MCVAAGAPLHRSWMLTARWLSRSLACSRPTYPQRPRRCRTARAHADATMAMPAAARRVLSYWCDADLSTELVHSDRHVRRCTPLCFQYKRMVRTIRAARPAVARRVLAGPHRSSYELGSFGTVTTFSASATMPNARIPGACDRSEPQSGTALLQGHHSATLSSTAFARLPIAQAVPAP